MDNQTFSNSIRFVTTLVNNPVVDIFLSVYDLFVFRLDASVIPAPFEQVN